MMMADKLHYRIAEKLEGENVGEFSHLYYLEKKTLANVLQIKYGY